MLGGNSCWHGNKHRLFTPVVKRDPQLQPSGNGDPNEVGDLSQRNPFEVRPNGQHAPDDCCPDDHDINRSQREIAKLELDPREQQICQQIDRKRQSHDSWDFSPQPLNQHGREADHDDRIDDLPDRSDCLWCGSPSWLSETVVPFNPGHDWLGGRWAVKRGASESATVEDTAKPCGGQLEWSDNGEFSRWAMVPFKRGVPE